jgi:hypothetical protein
VLRRDVFDQQHGRVFAARGHTRDAHRPLVLEIDRGRGGRRAGCRHEAPRDRQEVGRAEWLPCADDGGAEQVPGALVREGDGQAAVDPDDGVRQAEDEGIRPSCVDLL